MPSPLFLIQRVHLVGQVGDHQVGQSIVIVIGKIHAHAGISVAFAIHRYTGGESDFLKCAVAFVVVKKFRHGIVGDKNIHAAVAIVVRDRDAQALARLREADFFARLR